MSDRKYLDFIGNVYDLLPIEDKERMAETWIGYEQVFASAYQKIVENDLNIAIKDMQSYSTERWLNYTFNDSNRLSSYPSYTSTQDLSMGVNLTNRYLVRIRIDGLNIIEVDLRGRNHSSTTLQEIVDKINHVAGFNFARMLYENTIIQLVSNTVVPYGSIEFLVPTNPVVDATEFIFGLEQSSLPAKYPIHPYIYKISYERVVGIPGLRNKIRDESSGLIELTEGQDYEVQANGVLAFKAAPPEAMWAKKTLIDLETPWHNYGFLMDIHQQNSPSYLQVLQGLWFAFWTGPKPKNLQIALYLLFGLPVAEESCTVTSVSETMIQTITNDGVIREYTIPPQLTAIVTQGQQLIKFDPLVSGIEVYDKINKPGFVEEEIGRPGIQRFLTDDATRGIGDTDETKALALLEQHTFLPQISVDAFVSKDINLGNVKVFLNNIKPLTKTFLFQVIVGTFKDKVNMKDKLGFDIALDVTPNLDSNQTTYTDQATLTNYETTEDTSLNLDSDGLCALEELEIKVYSFGSLIDSFIA